MIGGLYDVNLSGTADDLETTRKTVQWNFLLAIVIAYLLIGTRLAPLFTECTSVLDHSDPDLTLKGLLAIHRRNMAR